MSPLLRNILLCLLPAAAMGAEPTDTLSLGGVEVSARRTTNPVTAATPVQTLDVAGLRKLGVSDMADAVRRFAGAMVKDYGGLGGLKTVSVRNMGATHTAVSYDGVAMTNTSGGQIDIGRLSLDNVATLSLAVGEQTEMLRPARLHASAAVLAVTASRPEFRHGRKTALQASVKAGAWGTVSPWIRIGRRIGSVTLSLDGDYLRSDGDYPFTIKNATQTLRERRTNADIESTHAEANIYADTRMEGTLAVKGYFYWSRRGLPGAVTLYNPVSTERLTDRSYFVQGRYRFAPAEKWRVEAQAKFASGFNLDNEKGPQFAGGVYETRHTQREGYASAAATWTPLRGLTVAAAQDGAIATLTSTQASCPNPTRYTSISALSARWSKGMLRADAGVTLTHISEHVDEGTRPEPLTRATPSVAVSLRPLGGEDFFVRAMYKRTFRAPTFTDLYYDRVGTRTLRPEDADEWGVGLTWSRPLFPAMEYLTLTADAYYNRVSNKIVAIPTTYTWSMVNFGSVDIRGLDLTAATGFALPADIHVGLTGAMTLQRAIDLTDPKAKNYRQQLPYTPRLSGNVGLTVVTPWLTVGYSVMCVGRRYYMAQNIPANEIGAYAEQTLALTRELKLRTCSLTLRAEVTNLGNTSYEVIKFYPMPGRSWRITAQFQL